ncbi:STE3-domain-containing protein [Serendipita vermifera]|nr:STE3-domain-containing protein [Serendipita vermifera]
MFEDMSYMYPSYPIACFFTMMLVLFPIPAHWKAGNIATLSLAAWTFFGLLMFMVNTIVWHGNIRNPYPVWGDISSAYQTILPIGLASSTLCIQYKLWTIARTKAVFITKREMHHQKYITHFLCWGLPLLILPIHYVVQGHRYNVYEDLGPMTTTYNVSLAFIIFYPWDPLLSLISGIFSVMTIRLLLAQQKEVYEALAVGSSVNKDRYLRLLWLAGVAIAIHVPLTSYSIIFNAVAIPIEPWISWEDTHSNYMRIAYVTRFMMMSAANKLVAPFSIGYWALVLCGINFFLFFGLGEEASKQYQTILKAVFKPFGIEYPKEKKRKTVKKTWIDILLGRPGKPVKQTPSFVGSVRRPSTAFPDLATRSRAAPPHPAPPRRTHAAVGDVEFNTSLSKIDFLDPFASRDQTAIAACTHPGQLAEKAKMPTGRNGSISWALFQRGPDEYVQDTSTAPGPRSSINELQVPEKVITIIKPANTDDEEKSSEVNLEVPIPDIDVNLAEGASNDLEAQELDEEAVTAEKRNEFLEKNPELTEEVTF